MTSLGNVTFTLRHVWSRQHDPIGWKMDMTTLSGLRQPLAGVERNPEVDTVFSRWPRQLFTCVERASKMDALLLHGGFRRPIHLCRLGNPNG